MFANYAKAVLITVGAFLMLPIAFETGREFVILFVAVALLSWFFWAVWRLASLARANAYRADAEEWNRESFGFAAGVISATPALVFLFATATAVRGPDERTITAGARGAFELALDAYRADVGFYPTTRQGLTALIINPGAPRWAGPYIPSDFRRYIDWFNYSLDGEGKPVLVARPRSQRKLVLRGVESGSGG